MGTRISFGLCALAILIGLSIRTRSVATEAASQGQWILVLPELACLVFLVVTAIAVQVALARPRGPANHGEVVLVTLSAALAAVIARYPGLVAHSFLEALAAMSAIVITTAMVVRSVSGRTAGLQAASITLFVVSAVCSWEFAVAPLMATVLVNP